MKSLDISTRQGQLVLGGILLVLGLLVGWIGRGALTAQDDVPRVAVYKDWRVACPPRSETKQSCEITQDVLDAKSRIEILHFIIANDSETKKRMLVITAPFGVLLPPGLGLQLGNDQIRVFRYDACNEVGCFAKVDLDDKLMEAFQRGGKSQILVAGPDEKPVPLNFSLSGFNDAVKGFETAEARRSSWFRRLWS